MKRFIKRGLALCLAVALAVPAVFASDALGSDLKGRTVQLAGGVTVTDNSLWSATYSDLRTEHYITYTPGQSVTPVVWYGSTVAGTARLTTAADRLREQGYRVVAGINGGFFNTDGTAVGLLMTDGVIRALDQWNYSMVGFCADGTAFIDSSDITKTLTWIDSLGQQVTMPLAAYNGSRDSSGVYLYNEDYGTSTKNSLPGVDVVLEPVLPGQTLTMNGTLSFRVVRVTDSTQEGVAADGTIPAGGYVLSANQNCAASVLEALRTLMPGTQITLTVSGGDSRWANAVYGVSGLYDLVENGQVSSGLETGAAPRTALGLKADGSMVLYTIDGRQEGYSVGASYTQVANRLIELGCIQAVALDGGGSTTLGATLPGGDTFSVLNTPSGSSLRAVNNCILLVTSAPAMGGVSSFYVDTASDVVLTGGQTTVTALPADMNGYAAAYSGGVSWSSNGGSVSYDELGNAVFTAGGQAGDYSITASGGGAGGSAPVRVVNELSKLTLTRRDTGAQPYTMNLSPGDTVELDAAGTWYNLPVAMADSNVTWTVEGNIGTVDADGLFTAGNENGTGTITAAAGGRTVSVSVTVDRGDPFTDIADHWSQQYVTRMYKMGLTTGTQQPDGTYVYNPDGQLTRGELLVFISRMLGVDVTQYESVVLPFADADSIAGWMLPHIKAMYELQVFSGSQADGGLYANVNDPITREMAMTMLGRVLAQQVSYDLSAFADADQVDDWAQTYVQTLVAQGVIGGSGGYLSPRSNMTRGEVAKVLTLVSDLPRAELTPRGQAEVPETEAPETEAPETEAPETEAPGTEAPETEAPDGDVPAETPQS